jgi:hypothetical protein
MTREQDDEENIVSSTFTSGVTAYGAQLVSEFCCCCMDTHSASLAQLELLMLQTGQQRYITGSYGTSSQQRTTSTSSTVLMSSRSSCTMSRRKRYGSCSISSALHVQSSAFPHMISRQRSRPCPGTVLVLCPTVQSHCELGLCSHQHDMQEGLLGSWRGTWRGEKGVLTP